MYTMYIRTDVRTTDSTYVPHPHPPYTKREALLSTGRRRQIKTKIA